MTWAQRLKRVFNIDIETCSKCGGDVRIIASIEDPAVIRKILAHLSPRYPNWRRFHVDLAENWIERLIDTRGSHGKGLLFYLYSAAPVISTTLSW